MDIVNSFADFQQTNLLKHVNTSIEKSKNYKARTAVDDVKSELSGLNELVVSAITRFSEE